MVTVEDGRGSYVLSTNHDDRFRSLDILRCEIESGAAKSSYLYRYPVALVPSITVKTSVCICIMT